MPDSNDASPLPSLDAGLTYGRPSQTTESPRTPDPDNPAWGSFTALLIWVATILLQFIIPFLFLIPYVLTHIDPNSPDFGLASLATDRTALLIQIVAVLPTHIVIFALLWAFVTRWGKRPFLASFGWDWPGRLGFWGSVALGVALFVVAMGVAKIVGAEKSTLLEQVINSSLAARYTIAALAVFTAPFVEEFIYRGVLYSALQRTFLGVRGAVILVLGLFTLIHVPQYWPNFGVIAAVGLLSVALTVIRAYSGRLLPCVVIHLVFNLIQAVILIIEPYAQRMLPAPPPVPTGSILFSLPPLIF